MNVRQFILTFATKRDDLLIQLRALDIQWVQPVTAYDMSNFGAWLRDIQNAIGDLSKFSNSKNTVSVTAKPRNPLKNAEDYGMCHGCTALITKRNQARKKVPRSVSGMQKKIPSARAKE